MNIIKVLLVDDHAVVRAGLRALLQSAPDMQVIGEAANGQQAVSQTGMLRPDVVLLDLAMPLLNGMEAARQIVARTPATKVLMLSSYSDPDHLRQAVAAGAAGYLLKQSAATDLLDAIRATANGGGFFSPPVLAHLVKRLPDEPPQGSGTNARRSLTSREAETLQLIAEGYASKQVAAVLSVSTKTVEKHRQSLMSKLNLHSIALLTRYAVTSGVVESNRPPNLGLEHEPNPVMDRKDNTP